MDAAISFLGGRRRPAPSRPGKRPERGRPPGPRLALDRAELAERVERPETPDEIHRADCVIFPLPIRGEGETLNAPLCPETHLLEDVFARLRPAQYLCGGRVDERTKTLAARYALTVHDYFLREELAVANAVPTALAV